MNSSLVIGILSVVVALDHVLALIPSINANNTFQLISNVIGQLLSALNPPKPGA